MIRPNFCPDCGDEPRIKCEDEAPDRRRIHVCCSSCACSTGNFPTIPEAVSVWNIRSERDGDIYVSVPLHATSAMVEAHQAECAGDADEAGPNRIRQCWSVMIVAAREG